MSEMSIAVLDLGTTGCKTTFFNDLGKIECHQSQEYQNFHPAQNLVEQDPDIWVQSALKTIGSNTKKGLGNELMGLIVTSQRSTLIGVQQDGEALGNAILWLD